MQRGLSWVVTAGVLGILLGLGLASWANLGNERVRTPRNLETPITKPTGFPSPPPWVDKSKLIIQQNPNCWIGVPGAVCDEGTRTFLGEK